MNVMNILDAAVHAAGTVALAQQGKARHVVEKGDSSDFATQADLDAGEAMEIILRTQLPQYPIIAEENKTDLPESEFRQSRQTVLDSGTFIALDDLDATFEFDTSVVVNGRRYGGSNFGHIAGVVEDHRLTHSVMYMPRHDLMISAKRDVGCYVNGSRHRLNQERSIEKSMICLVRHKDIPASFDDRLSLIVYTRHPGGYICLNSNIAAVSGVALGTLAACVLAGKIWDFPGLLAVAEAGGFIASADGQPFNWRRIPQVIVAAANEEIGQMILGLISGYDYDRNFYQNPKFKN